MKKFIFYLAAAGWIISLVIHILSLAKTDVEASIPYIWILHIGIFAVWIPAIRVLRLFRANQGGKKLFDIYRFVILNAPVWLAVLAIGSFVYCIIGSFIFLFMKEGTPGIINGQFVLHNHGKILHIITEGEYHQAKAGVMRLFSGVWLAFYGMAAAILYRKENAETI